MMNQPSTNEVLRRGEARLAQRLFELELRLPVSEELPTGDPRHEPWWDDYCKTLSLYLRTLTLLRGVRMMIELLADDDDEESSSS